MNKLISIQYLRAFASVFVLIRHVLQHLSIPFLEKPFIDFAKRMIKPKSRITNG